MNDEKTETDEDIGGGGGGGGEEEGCRTTTLQYFVIFSGKFVSRNKV